MARSNRAYDAVVVGGGPAGMAAALEMAPFGLRVALIDEQPEFGGQYFKRRHPSTVNWMGDFRPKGTALVEAVRASGVDCWTNTIVWGAGRAELWVSQDGVARRIATKAIIIATGAFERSVPFAGWTLPGVCTPGFALHLATIEGVRVGRRTVVAGTGPFLLSVASALLNTGVDVLAVIELNTPYRYSATALGMVRYPARVAELAGYLRTLWSHGAPIKQGWRVFAATGEGRVERVAAGPAGAEKWQPEVDYEVDSLCIAFGFRPATELVRLVGADVHFDPLIGDYVPSSDEQGRLSVEGVYVAGEVASVAGAPAALTRGSLAGLAVLEDLGVATPPLVRRRQGLSRRLARELRFANLAARLFPVPRWLYGQIPDDVVVCRCESVTAGKVRSAREEGEDIHSIKGRERVGMGPCQGRVCWNAVAGLLNPTTGNSPPFNARMPLKPVPIQELLPPGAEAGR